MEFSDFKKNKDKFAKITKKLIKPSNNFSDVRFWNPSKDDAGNGEALFRFLPQKNVEKNPFVLNFQHFFKEKGKWFVEKCPVTWEKECPICDYVQPFWDGTEEDKKIAGKYGRKKQCFANIYVIKDPTKPENNGQVFLYKFGKKIFDKILLKVSPKSELDTEILVYDLWSGMDFKLKIKKIFGYPNYDDSEWSGQVGPIKESDKEIEKIYNSLYDLDEFIDPKDCKTSEVLSEKFFNMIGKTTPTKLIEKKTEKVEEKKEEEKTPWTEEDEMKVHGKIEEVADTNDKETNTDEETDDTQWDWED